MSLVKQNCESWGVGKWCSALVDGCIGDGYAGDGCVGDGCVGKCEGSCEWEGEDVILEGEVE
ncbi:hypothetical protein Tco_0074468, partial [Tanacetum coccineum]